MIDIERKETGIRGILPNEFKGIPGVTYTVEQIALAQLIVEGVVGITHKLTLIPAKETATGESVMTLCVFQPGIEIGSVVIEPVAILLTDPSKVTEPELEHTDGAGNVKDGQDGDVDSQTPVAEGD